MLFYGKNFHVYFVVAEDGDLDNVVTGIFNAEVLSVKSIASKVDIPALILADFEFVIDVKVYYIGNVDVF